MKYQVLITSSGTGSRLRKLTKDKNKSLVKIDGVEVILRIINSYPDSSEFIITTGYFGKNVQKFLQKKLPKRNITFVEVDCYEGKGSSLGYSLLAARDKINSPFIFHCNDTLVFEKIPLSFSNNWIGYSKGNSKKLFSRQTYSSVKTTNGNVTEIYGKGEGDSEKLHIGLLGIHDYKLFFNKLHEAWKKNPFDSRLNDVSAINLMLEDGSKFDAKEFTTWLDTGNLPSLEYTESIIHSSD